MSPPEPEVRVPVRLLGSGEETFWLIYFVPFVWVSWGYWVHSMLLPWHCLLFLPFLIIWPSTSLSRILFLFANLILTWKHSETISLRVRRKIIILLLTLQGWTSLSVFYFSHFKNGCWWNLLHKLVLGLSSLSQEFQLLSRRNVGCIVLLLCNIFWLILHQGLRDPSDFLLWK